MHAPGAIPWLDRAGLPDPSCLDAILDRLGHPAPRGAFRAGQITGLHGTGKTTLLTHLAMRARARGWSVAESRPPDLAWPRVRPSKSACTPRLACIDSADQMSRFRWVLVHARARATGVAILVTTHRDLGCANIAHTAMSVERARRVLTLLAQPTGLTLPNDAHLAQMLARHNSSLRHVIFDLYDHYERGWPW